MNLALLIASLVSATLQGIPGLSSSIKQLVTDIASSLSAVISSGVTTTLQPATILTALAGVIAALRADPKLPQQALGILAGLDDAIAAALTADKQAQLRVDPSLLVPIAPLP